MQLIIVLLLFLIASTASAFERHFPHPDRIRYDGRCLTIDGKDTLIFSGAFHYFRCPKALWRDRFAKIKDAGFNCVETYVAWNWHERETPKEVNDFSKIDLTDLRDWLTMAHDEFGLYTIVRPGPYICAEWAAGGFPMWLTLKRPADAAQDVDRPWLRSDDPAYLAWSKHWMDAVCPEIATHQITRRAKGKAGTILVQVENEYDFLGGLTEQQRIAHLKSLVRAARSNGIDVPLITCWSKQVRGSTDPELREIFDGVNSYPRWKIEQTAQQLEKLRREQTDAPLMIPELQGGWFSNVGGTLSENQNGIAPAQTQAITMIALSRGATILNYYMLFGGTHFGDWAARGNTTSYDYAAAIREHGGVGEKYAVVKSLGAMLREIGPALARSKVIACEVEDPTPGDIEFIARATKDGPTFLFVWNKSRTKVAKGATNLRLNRAMNPIEIQYDLSPSDFKLLMLAANATDASGGKWFPAPVEPAVERPGVPPPIKIESAMYRDENGEADEWIDVPRDGTLASAGIFDSRFVFYRAQVTLSAEQARDLNALRLELHNADVVVGKVNGNGAWPSDGKARSLRPLRRILREGNNEFNLLHGTAGYGNFGADTALPAGLKVGALTHANARTLPLALQNWRVKRIDGDASDPSLAAVDVDDSAWPSFTLDDGMVQKINDAPQPGATDESSRATARVLFDRSGARAMFRCTMNLNAEAVEEFRDRALVFDRVDDDGIVFINGKEVARSTRWDRPCIVTNVGEHLRPGRNVFAVEVHNGDGPGGLTRTVEIEAAERSMLRLDWRVSRNILGVSRNWFGEQLVDPNKWRRVSFGDVSIRDGLVRWYRCEFELPALDANVWAPWLARIISGGDGFMYLNGHPLGRYWHIGPQHDFYLPECWLKFGTGQKNVLTFCLRDARDSLAIIQSIQIRADANYAERR